MKPIETPRMLLREWKDSDVDPFVQMHEDPRVMEFFIQQRRQYYVDSAAHLRRDLALNGFGWFVAEIKDRLPFAGVIALKRVNITAPFTPAFELGWILRADAWGRGYATEAAAAARIAVSRRWFTKPCAEPVPPSRQA